MVPPPRRAAQSAVHIGADALDLVDRGRVAPEHLRVQMTRFVERSEAMHRLGAALDAVLGPPPGRGSRRLAELSERILQAVVADYRTFMASVLTEIDGRLVPLLQDMHELRNGRRLPPHRTQQAQLADLQALDRALNGMRDLGEHVREILGHPDDPLARQLREELARSLPPHPRPSPVVPFDPLAGQSGALSKLDKGRQDVVRRALEREPERLGHAIGADTAHGLEQQIAKLRERLAGQMSPAELDALENAVTDLNPHQRRADVAYSGSLPEQVDRARFQAAAEGIRHPEMRAAVSGNPYLERISYESPRWLVEQWENFRKEAPPYPFWRWVFEERSQVRGRHGELQAAFNLGPHFFLVKAPKPKVTGRGTDLIAVDRRTGWILLIDNKAWKNPIVDRVDALTKNLLQNLGQDARDIKSTARKVDVSAEMIDVGNRLAQAEQALTKRLAGMDPDSAGARDETKNVLKQFGIELVITPEGGRVTGLTTALEEFDIDVRELTSWLGG